jgi:hypothetical protein
LPEDTERSIVRSAFLRRELMALRIELLAKEAMDLDDRRLDWGDRPALGLTDDAMDKVRKERVSLTFAFCHPELLALRPHLLLWYRGLAMMSRKELPGDIRGPEEKGKGMGSERARLLCQLLNRHICAVLAAGPVSVEALKGVVYSTAGATLQGKWGNKVGKIQVVFEEFVLDQLAALRQLSEVRTKDGWMKWSVDAVRDLHVLNARLVNGCFVEFGSNPDVAVYDREEPEGRTILYAVEVKGGTDESNAYYRLADAAETLQRSRHVNEHCFTVMVSESITAPVQELLAKEPYRSLVDTYYGVSQLLSDNDAQERFAADLRRVLGVP